MKNESLLSKILWGGLVVLVLIPFLFPFLWILSASFKTQAQIVAMPPVWVFTPTLENYARVFVEQDFGRFLLNSSIIAVGSTVLLFDSLVYSVFKITHDRFFCNADCQPYACWAAFNRLDYGQLF
ncbi:MAG: ABC-type transporter, integral rane subunit [Anaerospora sp.]|nr:ABC-type transporter, integral rane subunit [Anaerospora sp.]